VGNLFSRLELAMYTKSLLKPLDIDNHTLTKNCSTCIVSTQIIFFKAYR